LKKKVPFSGGVWLREHPQTPYIAPTAVIMVLLFILPILFVILISFTNYRLGMRADELQFLGASNYIRLFSGAESAFYYSLFISILFMLLATVCQMVLGMACAMLLNREFKLKGLVIACLVVPIVLTPSIASQIWKLMFNTEFGIVNFFLNTLFHLNPLWLTDYAFPAVLIATVWQSTPFVTLMLYAGLRSLPDSPYESAIIEGASHVQLFIHITLPLMKRLILLCTLLRSIDMLKTFDIPYVLTQGGPGNATRFLGLIIYDTGFGERNFVARAAAVAVVLILVVSMMSMALFATMNKNRDH
jgi:multiple sugar transport system permease protein